ncbi:hypothetical protein [Malaciobacter canalis]|nr:hypothetical protein [Malaciobacter canalis]
MKNNLKKTKKVIKVIGEDKKEAIKVLKLLMASYEIKATDLVS